MKRAISELANLPDENYFEEVSRGISLIVENAERLKRAANTLFDSGNSQGGGILSWYAAEESAKALILLDAIRCPKGRKELPRTLRYCYDHVAKGIYIKVCEWRPYSFSELCQRIQFERVEYYLDGPNQVDWIFPNPITSEREQMIYVDYVREVTEPQSQGDWISPPMDGGTDREYIPSAAVDLSSALHRHGATTPESLKLIARVWQDFEPNEGTTIDTIHALNKDTLSCLSSMNLISDVDIAMEAIEHNWPFPLWSLCLSTERVKRSELLRQRAAMIDWISKTEAIKVPKPVISKQKVMELSRLHELYEKESRSMKDSYRKKNPDKLGIPSSVVAGIPSLDALRNALAELSVNERVDLLALAWFTRDSIGNWPACHKMVSSRVGHLDLRYEASLGNEWLDGFELWEQDPSEFHPGRRRSLH